MSKNLFKPGQRVRCINPGMQTYIRKGEIYTVTRTTNDLGSSQLVYLEGTGLGFFASRFEAVDEEQVSINIIGKVVARGNGVASVETSAGVIVVPEELAPPPKPEASQGQREAVASFLRSIGKTYAATRVMSGINDEAVLKLAETLNA